MVKKLKEQRRATHTDVEIGRRLRLVRMERQMSQGELGGVLGISFQQVQKYEKGINRVSAARVVEICKLLKLDPHYLLGWDGNETGTVAINNGVVKMAQHFQKVDDRLHPAMKDFIVAMGKLPKLRPRSAPR